MPDAKLDRRQQAQIYCRRALDYYEQNKHGSAIKALGMALDLDRSLCDDPRIQRFAVELVGGSPEQAILILSNRTDREALASVLTKKPVKKSTILQRRLYYAAVGLIIAIFGGVSSMQQSAGQTNLDQPSSSSTSIPSGNSRFDDLNIRVEEHHLGSHPQQQYFISIPLVDGPLAVLVAVHGANQTGEDMIMQYGQTTTLYRDAVLIAPTFDPIREGTADEAFYESARQMLLDMIAEVKVKLPISTYGQIYMGYGEGASLVTYSALHDVYEDGQSDFRNAPLGVALFNPQKPLYSAPSHDMPYLLLYPRIAAEAQDSLAYKKQLEQQGVKVQSRTPKTADESADSQFGMVIGFMQEVYYNAAYRPKKP